MIGDDIQVVVVEIRGDNVRLGIECPKEIPVHRREIYEAIKRDKQDKATSSGLEGEVGGSGISNNPNQHKRYLESTEFLPSDKLSYLAMYEIIINKKQLQYIL